MVADVDIGLLYVFAMATLGEYGIVLGGWSSGNKYGVLGSLRAAAQMISYEVSLGLIVIGTVILAGSLRLTDIVEAQRHVWFICYQPFAFILYLVAGLAEINRTPFDMPEAESELACGFNIEYSSIKFALFFMAEYAHMITVAGVATTLFLGGWLGPGPAFLGPLWFFIKVFAILFFFVWERGTFPRMRYDHIMKFGWKVLFPLALANVVVTAFVVALEVMEMAYVLPLLKGLRLTLRRFFSRPITIQYPEQKKPMPPRWRGMHYFDKDEKGETTCVACGLCVAICPSAASAWRSESDRTEQGIPYGMRSTPCAAYTAAIARRPAR